VKSAFLGEDSSAPSFDGVAEREIFLKFGLKRIPERNEHGRKEGQGGKGAGLIDRQGVSMTPCTTQRESVTIKVLGRATHNTYN